MTTLSSSPRAAIASRSSRAGKPGTPFAFYFFMGTLGLALIYFLVLAISI